MDLLFLLLSGLLLLILLVILLWCVYRPPRLSLPSPSGLPILGNLHQFIRPRFDLLLTEWSRKLGPVFCFRLLHINIIVANDYDSINVVLVKQSKKFAGRPENLSRSYLFINEYTTGIAMAQPDTEWKFLRQMLHSHVKMYEKGLYRIESINNALLQKMVDEIARKGRDPVNPRLFLHNTAMNLICFFLLGRTFQEDDPFFVLANEVEANVMKVITLGAKGFELNVMWWLRHFGNKRYKELERLFEQKCELWLMAKQMVEQDIADSIQGGIIHDLLSALKNQAASMPESVDELKIKATFHDLILAGTKTTANTYYSFLNIMVSYPEIQAKLRREVDEVVGQGRAVGFNDRQSMPYTRATVIELTRYTSVTPLGVAHASVVDTSINGHHIPKNTMVITNLWALHHDEKFWGDPWEFRPERFLDDQGELLAADHELRKHVLAFTAGVRVCPGEVLALGRLFLFIATMVQRFEMLPGPNPVSCDPREYESGAIIGNSDFLLRFIPR